MKQKQDPWYEPKTNMSGGGQEHFAFFESMQRKPQGRRKLDFINKLHEGERPPKGESCVDVKKKAASVWELDICLTNCPLVQTPKWVRVWVRVGFVYDLSVINKRKRKLLNS